MTRPAAWKVLTVGAAITGLGLVSAGAAVADTNVVPQASPVSVATVDAPLSTTTSTSGSSAQDCTNRGGITTHCQTNGSTQIYTAPNPRVATPGIYGPFFFQNRGLGGVAR